MRVFLPRLALTEWTDLRVDELEALAAADRFRVHELVDGPETADVVLYVQCHMVDWRLRDIATHDTARRHWAKVMVYDERDRPWCSFPGIYVSSPSLAFDGARQRAWSYPYVAALQVAGRDPDLLFSFVGSSTAACREPLLALSHPDAIVEESRDFMFWDGAGGGFHERRRRYQEVLARSRFVLCPRGRGTSTIRLYETLAAGRVPVVISDDWMPPEGPEWESFSLRIPEHEIGSLVELLEDRDRDWARMSTAAAAAFGEFFGDDVAFHRIVELLDDLRNKEASVPGPQAMWIRGAAAAAREKSSRLR